jgi:phosphoserine phosphatase RsbU/P
MDYRILIIDDNPSDAELITRLLTKSGFSKKNILHAESGREAESILSEEKNISCIILDYNLPDSDGISFMKEHLGKNIPFVILTGEGDEKLAVEFMKTGAMDYQTKGSLDADKLKRTVQYSINQKKILVEKEKLFEELESALDKVKQLKGLLPICSRCHKIRNDKGYWESLENYISSHSEAEFTHGLCTECAKILYPDFYEDEKK